MTAEIANSLRMLVFGFMNGDKANNAMRTDCKERGMVSILQLKNSASGVLDMAHGQTGKVASCLNNVSDSIKSARNTSKIFDGVCKSVNVVSDMVNPLLVVASCARVYNSDDKKSALVRETGSMTGMFVAENAYKNLFGLKTGKEATYKNYKSLTKAEEVVTEFCKTNKYLSKLPLGKLGGIIKGLGFIAASCTAFAIGGEIGDVIAQHTTAKEYEEKHALEQELSSDDSTKEYVS